MMHAREITFEDLIKAVNEPTAEFNDIYNKCIDYSKKYNVEFGELLDNLEFVYKSNNGEKR